MVRIGSWTNLFLVLVSLALVVVTPDLARGYWSGYLAGAPNMVIAGEAILAMIISVACFVYPALKG